MSATMFVGTLLKQLLVLWYSVTKNNNKEYEVVNALLSIIWKDIKAN